MNILMKTFLISIIAVMLIHPVLGEGGSDRMDKNSDMMKKNTDDMMKKNTDDMMKKNTDDMMKKNADDMMKKGREMRSSGGMMGMGFMHTGGSSFGSYVMFTIDNTTGTIINYSISGIPVFDSIKISNFNYMDSKTTGAVTKITNKENSIVIQLHDNPAAVINIMTKAPTSIIFSLSDGASAAKEDNIIKIQAGNLTAYIAANATSSTITGNQIRIESRKGNTIFRSVPVNMPMGPPQGRFMGEMMKNKAGAEIAIGENNMHSIVNYSENMDVMVKSMEKKRMRMSINTSDHAGKYMILNLDNSSMMWTEKQKIRLYLDDKPMKQVGTQEELYTANESCFWLNMNGGNRMEAMMYIANFSERMVDVVVEDEAAPAPANTTAAETPSETPEKTPAAAPKTPGFELMLGTMAAALAYLRKK